MKKQKWNEERIAFLKINSNELGRSRDKNIKDLKDTLVHQKVSEQALSPWMLSETFDL